MKKKQDNKVQGMTPTRRERWMYTIGCVLMSLMVVVMMFGLMVMARGWWQGAVIFAVALMVFAGIGGWMSEYDERYGKREEIEVYKGEDLFEE